MTIAYLPLFAVLTTRHDMPEASSGAATYVVSRVCRSVNVRPSVTTNCMVSTLVLSIVG